MLSACCQDCESVILLQTAQVTWKHLCDVINKDIFVISETKLGCSRLTRCFLLSKTISTELHESSIKQRKKCFDFL